MRMRWYLFGGTWHSWPLRLVLSLALSMISFLPPGIASANVFYAQDEALAMAFQEGVEVIEKTTMLSSEQQAAVEALAQTKLTSSLFHYFEGKKDGQVTGYAVIDSRIMRTNLAVFMVVLSKDLVVQKVVLLAFNEPSEYQPTDGWLKQLEGDKKIEELLPGQGLPPIAGSTLSVTGLSDGVRAVRASVDVIMKGAK
jgi:hypothetical protein